MLKAYRKRFVQLNMLLVGAVLLVTLVLLGAYLYHNAYRELQMTMQAVLRPLDTVAELQEGAFLAGLAPGEGQTSQIDPPEPLPPDKRGPKADSTRRSINTVFYNRETGDALLLAATPLVDQASLADVVEQVLSRDQEFGALPEYRLIYFRPLGQNRIALASTRYVWDSLKNIYLILVLVFAAAMGLFWLISRRISLLAVRPLEAAMLREKQFVADASHDLKTPLTIVLANTGILREHPDATVAQQAKWIDSTEQAVKRMQGLVDEMLTLSQADTQDTDRPRQRVDLSSLLTRAVLQMESLAYEKSVALESDIPEGIAVAGWPDELERIAQDLMGNALKYEPAGGAIRVTLERARHSAVLTVCNRGSVIPPDDLPYVFQRFYRADKTRSGSGGHGLGLAIVKRMAENMDGTVAVESAEGRGTVFRVTLPLAK